MGIPKLVNRYSLIVYSFIFNLIMTFVSYAMFLQMHFSVDSYAIIYDNSGQQYLMQGRIVSYILNNLLNRFNINPTLNQQPLTLCLIISISLCGSVLVKILYDIFNNKNITYFIMINIIVCISYCNVFLLEWFLYPEITLFLAIGLISVFFSIWVISKNSRFINLFIAFIMLNISMGIYQANLGIFIIYGLLILYIKNKGNLNKNAVVYSIKILFIGAFTSLINILSLKWLVYMGKAVKSDRDPNLNIETIKNNIIGILKIQKQIWSSTYGLLPKYALLFFVVVIVCSIIYLIVKNKINFKSILYLSMITIGSYLIIFVPHIFTNSLWIAQRTIVPFFSFISFLGLILLFFSGKDKSIHLMLGSISVMFLVINIVYIQLIGSNHISSNRMDQQFSILIDSEIKKYEENNNIKINNISAECDVNPTYNYNNIKYCIYDTNVRAFITPWANVNMINYYTNSSYKKVEMDMDIHNKYFKDKNWDNLNLKEQLIFSEDTLFLVIY